MWVQFIKRFLYKNSSLRKVTTMRAIINSTKKSKVSNDYMLCRSVSSKALGLMFSNEAKVRRHALLFEFNKPSIQSMHMFFVFYPIDLIFLDDKKKVVEMKKRFLPFTTYTPNKMSKYVIELPSGTITRSKTDVGDTVKWL